MRTGDRIKMVKAECPHNQKYVGLLGNVSKVRGDRLFIILDTGFGMWCGIDCVKPEV